ncbi:MAG: FAD-binding oxidoreductase [Kofleriaceae bacterium]|nr:FAD-binding oxidoreductase [Kofleriaceae bacterium]MCL4228327.1 FAD-binding oxidoreductase [Myxococcales bacterium]
MTAALRADLEQALGAEHVAAEDAREWRVSPGAAAEVAEVVRIAGRHGAAVIPVGSASRAPRLRGVERSRVMVSTRRLDQVIHLDETSLLCHVQAGLTGLGLEKVLTPRGLSIGDYPPSLLGSTLGGLVAVRTPGKSSARHGFFEDAVLGLSAVLADGRTVHTRAAPRRATGPDLARALCGSEGTLGLITSVVLRIHRRPEARFLAAFVLPGVDAAVAATYLALREEAAPAGLRVLDAAEAAHWYGAAVCGDGEAVLVAATAGPTDLAACDRDLITSAVRAEGGRDADLALAETWWKRRHSAEPWPGPPPSFQLTATPARLCGAYHAVRGAVTAAGAAARVHLSRFDATGAVLFVTFVDPEAGPVATAPVLTGAREAAVRDAALTAARAAGGYLFGGRARELDPYLQALRAALDPDGLMNPGALVG